MLTNRTEFRPLGKITKVPGAGTPPAALACDQEYRLVVRVYKLVQEEKDGAISGGFAELYRHARELARRRIEMLECPRGGECGPLEYWESARSWGTENDGNDRVAFATVKYVVICPNRPTGTEGLGKPDPETYKRPHTDPERPAPDFDELNELIRFIDDDNAGKVMCDGVRRTFDFRYYTSIPDCDSVRDKSKWRAQALLALDVFEKLHPCLAGAACRRLVTLGGEAEECQGDEWIYRRTVHITC